MATDESLDVQCAQLALLSNALKEEVLKLAKEKARLLHELAESQNTVKCQHEEIQKHKENAKRQQEEMRRKEEDVKWQKEEIKRKQEELKHQNDEINELHGKLSELEKAIINQMQAQPATPPTHSLGQNGLTKKLPTPPKPRKTTGDTASLAKNLTDSSTTEDHNALSVSRDTAHVSQSSFQLKSAHDALDHGTSSTSDAPGSPRSASARVPSWAMTKP